MNVLDVAENSVAAGSTLTSITVEIDTAKRLLAVTIADNGKGMDEETVRRVTDPFYTTRTTVRATFTLGHIDLAPLGDMTGTVVGLVQCNPKIDFVYRVVADGEEFCMDTREVRGILEGVPLSTPEVAVFLRGYLQENTENLLKRSTLI